VVSGKTGALDGLGEGGVAVGDGTAVLTGVLAETDADALCEASPGEALPPHALSIAVTNKARICRIRQKRWGRRPVTN